MLKNAICSRLTAALMPATSTPPSTPTTSAISTSEVSRALTKARQRGGASTKNVVVVIPASLRHDPEKHALDVIEGRYRFFVQIMRDQSGTKPVFARLAEK